MSLKYSVKLPPAVAAYFEASNKADREGFLATFAEDTLVRDVRREARGKAAIKEWAAREIFAVNVTMEIMRITKRDGDVIVTVKLDGTFDKTGLPDPLLMTNCFTVKDGKIVKLIIEFDKPVP